MLQYIVDKELTYKDKINFGLSQYNLPITGKRPTDQFNVYVFEENTLVGAAITEMGWEWVYFKGAFFQNLDIGKAIIKRLRIHYLGSIEGIKIRTVSPRLAEDLQSCGFQLAGTLSQMPKDHNEYFLTNRLEMDVTPDKDYRIEESAQPLTTYQEALHNGVRTFMRKYQIPMIDHQFDIVCLDEDEFAGGLYGYFEDKVFYTQLLFVESEYRTQGVGSELLKRAEAEAKRLGAKAAFVSTTSFQAFDFYIKQGYTHDLTIKDKPRGFDEFTFSKHL